MRPAAGPGRAGITDRQPKADEAEKGKETVRNPLSRGLAAAALTAALTFTLQAADGVTEINQALIEASGGFPYEITQPGSYLLTGNLTVPDADTTAIRVEATDVTLDLNGFAIIGPVQCAFEDEQTIHL